MGWGVTAGGRESEAPSSIPRSKLALGTPAACPSGGRRISLCK